MSAIPGDVETDKQPPMTVPLRHFLVGLAALLAGALVGLGTGVGLAPGLTGVAHVHLLLAGWVCITIMGAMTQFVPVWSGTALHSRRLATAQLWLVVLGLAGFVAALLSGSVALLALPGAVMLAGFWTFVYNITRTLPTGDLDVTETHFALALGFFLLVTGLGVALAASYAVPVFGAVGVARSNVVAAHATLAVFGAVLTTVLGALYQLATMFTQTDLHRGDRLLQRAETVAYPLGVVTLAAGRLVDAAAIARVGGLLVLGGLCAVAAIVGRKLYETRVEWTPMLSRYAVFVLATPAWALVTLPAWATDPTASGTRFGAPGSAHLLAVGVVGFVVLGTLYHVVPFIVWVHRYSDLLGFRDVPMIDDLYDTRLARADFTCFLAGLLALAVAPAPAVPRQVALAGGACLVAGVLVFAANVLLVLREHSPHSLAGILFDALATDADQEPEPESAPQER